jgi:hypothetical protein
MFESSLRKFVNLPSLPPLYTYGKLRQKHSSFISNNLNKYFHNERLQVDVKTYEMDSGMYVTYFKDLFPTTKNKLPLVIVGDPILSSFSMLYPPTISTLLRKYSRIYVIDLPGVGMNNEKKLVDSYLSFRDTLPTIDPAYRLKISSLTGRLKYIAGSHDHEYLDKIDRIREFYFDDAFDEFITRHQFQKIDMLTLSVSSYFVIKFFENYNKSVVDKLHIIGEEPLTSSVFTMNRNNPSSSISDIKRLPQYTKEGLYQTVSNSTCLVKYLQSRVLREFKLIHKFLEEEDRNLLDEYMKVTQIILQKQHEKDFDTFADVAYNLFTGKLSPFEDYFLTYNKYNKFININSFEIYHLNSWENTIVEEDEECLPSDLKSDMEDLGVVLVDGVDAELIEK